ncbi:DNA repair protein RecN [Mobilicoccus pelagius]|uniref:DNA repair protein RecN n=1 Tax=Mobilicoccus pelagius NBRC 104925 TaxID=1089455 RepID=H5UV68_9MICO|nr:DNA repair protein RecN [Mobilicoccus pelagius]GAB49626.1 DNA repair protein RecN [Mobilicoccus pelagius NBRC 104925]
MLTRLRLRRLGVIDDAVLDLTPGLNVLTGETGAGKTMVVSGLGLLLGSRADASLVRSGAKDAVVEGALELPPGHPALVRAADAGAEDDDGELVLVRTVAAQGRSRAHVGGRTAPVGVLGELGEMLVVVHGQSDQWRLRSPEEHRVMLDDSDPAIAPLKQAYAEAYAAYHDARAELVRLRELDDRRTSEADALRAGLADLERLDPQPGEDVALAAESQRLSHVDGLRTAAGVAQTALVGDETSPDLVGSVTDLLAQARSALTGVGAHDEELSSLGDRIGEIATLTSECASDLGAYLAGLDVDPGRLEEVENRRAELTRLTRAYGDSVDAALAWGQRAAARLDELESAHERADGLEDEVRDRLDALRAAAAALTEVRTAAAGRLAEAVTGELAHLAMGKAIVECVVEPRTTGTVPGDDTHSPLGTTGADDVDIRMASGPGLPLRTVAKAASGGELSRVMLALEVVISGAGGSAVPTFVFDEVDAGIGGRAAIAVGARLAALARHAQVIVVTHLAQVAAHADNHLVVRKTDDGHVTESDVVAVTGEDREREIARMMAGVDDTEAALDHARELLAQARPDAG